MVPACKSVMFFFFFMKWESEGQGPDVEDFLQLFCSRHWFTTACDILVPLNNEIMPKFNFFVR
jgi:hypothetical protein